MKLYQVSRVLVFGSSGAVHREPMKTFENEREAHEFKQASMDMLAEAAGCMLMRGSAAEGQPTVMTSAEKLLASLGIQKVLTVVTELPVEESRRIHVPQLELVGRH